MSFNPYDWTYRKKITISGSPGAGIGYQVLLKVGESAGASNYNFHVDGHSAKFPSETNDSGDLRFADGDGTTLLSFWVEKVEGTAPNRVAYCWVKIKDNLDSDVSIYCYCGNANADNVSNVVNTFIRVIDGVVGSWHFDEGEGNIVHDSSGNDNDGTIHEATWVDGKFGKALSFDGSNDYVTIGKASNIVNNFTMELWINPSATHEIDSESTSGTVGTSGQRYAIFPQHGDSTWGSGHAGAGISAGENGVSVYEHADNYIPALLVWQGTLSGWNHVIVVYTNKQPTLYINGNNVRTGLTSPKSYVHPSMAWFGGGDYGYFQGFIDEVRIYNKTLSQEEISDLYNNCSYTTINYPGKVLIRKYVYPEPVFSSIDNIESLSTLQGTVCDKNGNPIIGTSVKIFLLNKDTGELLQTTTSNSEDGSWSVDFWTASPKTLAVFALEGTYGEDTDIAGAEFLETE